ncbi:MAG TPA: lytic transglycosylase domain-containing protein [Thermoanaerobaculia bacterium]|nr:lytic transglycosylase domain-containing protein [Thermoanaerobaculia bacterium]
MRLPLRRFPAGVFLLLSLVSGVARGFEEPAAPAPGPNERLAEIRRLLREEGSASARAAALVPPLAEASDLWAIRLRTARAVLALAKSPETTIGAPEALETARLGIPGLGSWVALMGSRPSVGTLLAFAAAEPLEPLARDAATFAARMARTPAERSAVRAALVTWELHGPRGPRAAIDLALARARVSATGGEALRLRFALAAEWPDAPERAADLFDATDLAEFDRAVRRAPEEIRAARGLALAPRTPKEAASILPRSPVSAAARLDAAEARLITGDTAETLRLLRTAPPLPDGPAALRARSLVLDAEMRALLRSEGAPAPARRAGRRRARLAATPPAPPRPLGEAARQRADSLLTRADELLGAPLSDADRRRLLVDASRLSLRAGSAADARLRIARLVLFEPGSRALSEDHFREAFDAWRAGRFAEAAEAFEEQRALFRDITLRRRATYWAGRCREKAGQTDAARLLYASLVAGTSPDLYAVWAAAAIGVPLTAGPSPMPPADDLAALDGVSPAAPSRELLACGLPDLAEDAAEAEGSADPLFLATAASERGDHRRTASLLKQRWPELGSPEEGGVPLPVRRLYYPHDHAALLVEAAFGASVPSALVFGLVRQESVFTTDIRSRAGAVGLMQVMPATGRQLHRREGRGARPDLKNPAVNVHLGVAYLRHLLDQFGGDPVLALAAYNAGPARARRWRADLGSLPADEFVESIPVAESRHYIKRVLFFEGAYAALYGLPASPPVSLKGRAAAAP